MTMNLRALSAAVLFFAVFACAVTAYADKPANLPNENHVPVCPRGGNSSDSVRCHAHVITDKNGTPNVTAAPAGYGPAQFHAAYSSATTAPSKQIIAIVDAYDDPSALSDLNVYSQTYGIPTMPQCSGPVLSSAVPCFQKINQRGGTSVPAGNAGWALEISLDVQAAHAMCQNCSILLVEADSNSFANLMAAVDRAVLSGATVISNSYGSPEFSGENSFDSHFNHPQIAFTVSSGDNGYGAQYPAASPYVTAVGGTTLIMNGTLYGNERAWSGAGSGCSTFEAKPIWQKDTLCADHRTVADVSADADPNTGAAVYDSVRYQGRKGWFKVGGTSLAAPLIAGVYALSGNTLGAANSIPYANVSALHDVVGGSNGSCGGTYLCTALSGFDGPTGLGSPNGLAAF